MISMVRCTNRKFLCKQEPIEKFIIDKNPEVALVMEEVDGIIIRNLRSLGW